MDYRYTTCPRLSARQCLKIFASNGKIRIKPDYYRPQKKVGKLLYARLDSIVKAPDIDIIGDGKQDKQK